MSFGHTFLTPPNGHVNFSFFELGPKGEDLSSFETFLIFQVLISNGLDFLHSVKLHRCLLWEKLPSVVLTECPVKQQ